MFDLGGRVALVTGGASGLGAAIAGGLAQRGAQLAIADLDLPGAEQVVKSIEDKGGAASAWRVDVSQHGEVEDCVAAVTDATGGIDVLVVSAGIGLRRPAVALEPKDWQRVIDINLSGCWFCNQAVGRRMVERGLGGSIINIGSVVGQVGIDTGNANYAASKGGMIGLTKCLAVEWAPFGVRVNVVAPTHFRTPLVEQAIRDNPAVEQRFLGNIPLGRLGKPREIVGAVVFLASDEASMVTGHVLNVDGGHTAR
jgi:NAD(P)-dependent dehydrogenase (short-subunit alcohol dehydrogenase family)